MTKVVPTETDPPSATSDAAQGGAYVDAISEPIAHRVEQLTQLERGSIGSTASLHAEGNIPGEENRIIGPTEPLPGENKPPMNRLPNPSGSAAAAAEVEESRLHPSLADKSGGVLNDASNASDVSSTVPEPGANQDEVEKNTGSHLIVSSTTTTPPSESREGQQQRSTINGKSNENKTGGSAQFSPTPKISEIDNGSTASLPAEGNIPGGEKRIIGSTKPLPGENMSPPVHRLPNRSGSAATDEVAENRLHPSSADNSGGVLNDASNAADVSTVPEPGANKDEVDNNTGSILNISSTTPPSERREGQQQCSTVNEKSNENETEGSARFSSTSNISEIGKDKHGGDGDGDGDRTINRTSLSHPNVDAASLANADKSPIVLSSGHQESKDHSGASSPSNNTLDTEEYDEEEFKPAAGGGAVFARRGTGRFMPRSSSDKANDKLASEQRPSFHVPPAMFMGHPVGSLSAEFLERHERRVKEATIRRESVSELLKLVMNHDPVSSGSPMPDIDVVFPDYHSDQNEGDWFV